MRQNPRPAFEFSMTVIRGRDGVPAGSVSLHAEADTLLEARKAVADLAFRMTCELCAPQKDTENA